MDAMPKLTKVSKVRKIIFHFIKVAEALKKILIPYSHGNTTPPSKQSKLNYVSNKLSNFVHACIA